MTLETLIAQIVPLHEKNLLVWEEQTITLTERDPFLKIVEENHAFNTQLWHAEDRARREDKGYDFVYHAKREIDHCNQQRNNRMEAIDAWLVENIQPSHSPNCPVHSETPGMMIDRLSILSLKTYHMHQQSTRASATFEHRQHCERKLMILLEQKKQLNHCLQALIQESLCKTRTFRHYHQFKMYNDPLLNPELYNTGS